MNQPASRKPTGCTCKHYPDFRALNRACPIHGDQAEAARRDRGRRSGAEPGNVTTLPSAPDQAIRQHRPDFSAAGFGRRLVAGLDALEIPVSERAAKVAKAGGVTIRTARRYLKGESQPRGIYRQKLLAEGLGLNFSWLTFERPPITEAEYQAKSEDERKFLEAVKRNPPWRQRLIERTLTRMANKSPRVERLMTLQEQGQLSPDDFLKLAGR